jgi:hypothetical protein
MDQYTFAITSCGQHYDVKESTDLNTLFQEVKPFFPLRCHFKYYLSQAINLPEGYVRLTDPDPKPGEDVEMLFGEYQAISKYVRLQEEGIDEDEEID